jgi:hypothetical protein
MYVLKFRGAGQGIRALIAELLAGELARRLELPVPEIVFADVTADLARTEPDPEIHALIKSSAGVNLALDYLPGSIMFDPRVDQPAAELCSRIVWFDAYVSNVDRTPRNPNMLMWHRQLWLIDHGASLYFHHTPGWEEGPDRSRQPFPLIADHVLRRRATMVADVDARMAALLSSEIIGEVVEAIPEEWLQAVADRDAASARASYRRYLVDRLQQPRAFVPEAAGGD